MRIALPRAALAASTARLNGHLMAAALLLCVTVLVGVSASALFLRSAMEANARQLLAADLRLQAALPLQAAYRTGALPGEVLAFAEQRLAGPGRQLSPGLEFSAMARVAGGERTLLVEVKAVAADYPLRGRVQLEQALSLTQALADGGVVVEKSLLTRLGVGVGDAILLGDATLTIAATLAYEPDRVTHLFNLGPRVIMPLTQVARTGLLQTGSRVTQVVSVRLAEGENAATWAETLRAGSQVAGLRVLTPEQSQPTVRRFIRRFTLFLALTSLLTLLVAGLAMTGAMAAYLRESRTTIAVLKLLGAETGQVVAAVLWATLRLAWPASLAGGILGVLLPGLMPRFLAGLFPAEAVYHPSIWLALTGTGLGLLFSLLCAAGPLWWTRQISPARLFCAATGGEAARPVGPAGWWLAGLALLGVAGAALGIIHWSGESRFGLMFAAGLGGVVLLAWGLARVGLWWLARLQPRRVAWRLARHALLRRGEHQGVVIMALGLGLGLVSAVLLLEENLHQQMVRQVPQRMPGFFFIDIQPDQVPVFQEVAHRFAAPQPDAVHLFPTVRGRLLNGGQTVEEEPDQPQSWRKAREYVLTQADELPVGNRLVAGTWWSDPSAREASVEVEMARGLGLSVGDMLAFDIQGVTVTARIANLRAVRWSDLGLNFFVIFSPAVLQGAPMTWLASVVAPVAQEEALLAAMSGRLHNVTAIATRTVLESLQALLQQVARSARLLGGAAVAAGLLVLGVSVLASRPPRTREIALYRLIGATRGEVARIAAAEFVLLGGMAAVLGVLIGQGITALAVEGLLNDLWTFNFPLTLLVLVGGAGVVLLTGWVGSRQALDQPVMAVLHPHDGR
ncbi:MAG: ABC transporter permease [Magnetococcus sp. DMHC-8]